MVVGIGFERQELLATEHRTARGAREAVCVVSRSGAAHERGTFAAVHGLRERTVASAYR